MATRLTLEHVGIAIEPVRWVLLNHAAVEGGFFATAAVGIAGDAGFALKPKNARNHAETLEAWGLLGRRPERPVYFIRTAEGVHLHAALSTVIEAVPEPPRTIVGLVARVAADEVEVLAAASGGVEVVDDLIAQLPADRWRRYGVRL